MVVDENVGCRHNLPNGYFYREINQSYCFLESLQTQADTHPFTNCSANEFLYYVKTFFAGN